MLVSSRSITATGYHCLDPVERARVGGLAAGRRLHHRDAVGGDADERIRGGRVRHWRLVRGDGRAARGGDGRSAQGAHDRHTRAARTAETRRLAVAPRAAVRDASVAGRDDVIIVERPTTRAARDGGVSVRATSGGRFAGAGLGRRARR